MAPVIPFIPLIAAGVTTIGGAITGNRAAKQNEKYIQAQDQQFAQVREMANSLVSRVTRGEYEAQANTDVNAALKDVFGVMASRGMGRSTAGLTAASGASAQIRSTYGQKYLSDRLSALQTAGSMISGVATAPRMGYDSNPFAGMQSGLQGLSTAAAYYQANGMPGRTPAAVVPPLPQQGGGFGVTSPYRMTY